MLRIKEYIINEMLKKIPALIIGTYMAFAPVSPLFAQDTAKSVKWDLQTCLDYAKENNVQLNTLKYSQKTAEQNYLLSKAAVLPSVSGSVTQTIGHSNSVALSALTLSSLSTTSLYQSTTSPSGSYELTSSWTLYQGGYLKNDIKQKDLSVESANLSVLQEENDLTLQITQYYLNILLDKESIIYEENVVGTSQAQEEQSERQLAAGSIARKDVAQFKSQLANDKYALITSQNAKRQDLLTLKQVLELPSAIQFDITDPDTIISKKAVPALADVQATALATRPEVKNGQAGVDIAKFGLTKAQSGYQPTLTASGSIGTSYDSGSGYFGQLNNGFNQQIGVTLSIPIFTKRINKTNVEEAKIAIDQAQLTLKDTKNTLSLNIEKAYINVVNAENQFDAAAEAFKYNQETYRIANEQLRLGVSNMVEFLQQKELYIQALQQYIQAKYNAALTIEIYDFYYGEAVKL
jgi:outer membrane protein